MTANYELKKGVLLQEFGFPNKACTNITLTDELAVWHLSRHPEKAVFFTRISPDFTPIANLPPPPPPPPQRNLREGDKRIIAPDKINIPEQKVENMADKLIEKVTEPVIIDPPEKKEIKEVIKPEVKKSKKTSKTRK